MSPDHAPVLSGSSKYFQAPATQSKKGHKPKTFVCVWLFFFFNHLTLLISNISSSLLEGDILLRRKLSYIHGTTILYFSEIISGITLSGLRAVFPVVASLFFFARETKAVKREA